MSFYESKYSESEEMIRYFTEEKVLKNDEYKIYIEAINVASETIYQMNTHFHTEDKKKNVIKYLGTRMINSSISMRKLLYEGYYQQSYMLLRDIIETGLLIEYFVIDPEKIEDWIGSDERTKRNQFQPSIIRKEIARRSNLPDGWTQVYSIYSEFASHPTYNGSKLVIQNGKSIIGPFFEAKYLLVGFETLAQLFPYFTLSFLQHFKSADNIVLEIQGKFVDFYKELMEEKLFSNLSKHIRGSGGI